MISAVIRFVVAALVLMAMGFLVPGVEVAGFGGALIAAIVIAVIGYVLDEFVLGEASKYQKGIVGFLVAAAIIFVAQFIAPGFNVSVIGALIAAAVIGIIDAIIPLNLEVT